MSEDKRKTDAEIDAYIKNTKTTEELMVAYEKWAENNNYDKDFEHIKYRGGVVVAENIANCFSNGRSRVSILDVASGTGIVAEKLKPLGFEKIDALDPCQAMLDASKEKRLYQRYILAYVDEHSLDICDGTYDAVTCAGAVGVGHIPAVALHELVRIVKTGGVVVISGNAGAWQTIPEYYKKMESLLNQLKAEKKIEIIKKEFYDGYRESTIEESTKGIIIVFKKL